LRETLDGSVRRAAGFRQRATKAEAALKDASHCDKLRTSTLSDALRRSKSIRRAFIQAFRIIPEHAAEALPSHQLTLSSAQRSADTVHLCSDPALTMALSPS